MLFIIIQGNYNYLLESKRLVFLRIYNPTHNISEINNLFNII